MEDKEISALMYVTVSICCLISTIACIWACRYLLKKCDVKIFEVRAVLVLLIFDTLLCTSSMIPAIFFVKEVPGLCYLQGILIQVFSLTKILWTGFIGFAIFYDFLRGRSKDNLKFFQILAGVFIFSLITAIIPGVTEDYDASGPWCWFWDKGKDAKFCEGKDQCTKKYEFYLYGFLYVILWLVILFNFFTFFYVARELKQNTCVAEQLIYVKRLRVYPFILLVGYIPLSILRMGNFQAGDKLHGFEYTAFGGAFSRLIGLANAIAYLKLDRNFITRPDTGQTSLDIQSKDAFNKTTVFN